MASPRWTKTNQLAADKTYFYDLIESSGISEEYISDDIYFSDMAQDFFNHGWLVYPEPPMPTYFSGKEKTFAIVFTPVEPFINPDKTENDHTWIQMNVYVVDEEDFANVGNGAKLKAVINLRSVKV